jgi:dihydrodipicolinate synthase/N-acetylneuraminate lyase
MNKKKVSGAYAAVLTPRLTDDTVDVASLRKLIEFLMASHRSP